LTDFDQPLASAVAHATELDHLLRELVRTQGSDLHIKPRRPPLIRVNGLLTPLGGEPLPPDTVARMLDSVIPERLRPRLANEMAIDFGHSVPGCSRFRASVYSQRGTLAAVFRRVPIEFPSLDDWGLPPVLEQFCDLPQGLVLITGPTGSGKSSTLAAMMRRVAGSRGHHIVTIEDPIEFLIGDDLASISQREIGIDTPSFPVALRNALRQDPDVIMVGEMRDEETIRTVLAAAETGHLVFSTLHTNDAVQSVDRIITTFPENNHRQIRQQLAACLEAVVSLLLVPRADGHGLVAAVEIMRRSPQVSKLILEGDFQALREAIETSVTYHKMQTMNQSLAALTVFGAITRETAMDASANPGDLDLMLRKLVGASGGVAQEGDPMAEPMSDFSRILQLQEVKKHYDDLQARHADELAARDHEIAQLRAEASKSGESEERVEALRRENVRLAEQLKTCREEYEQKLQRLTATANATRTRPAPPEREREPEPEAKKRGFFR
jgi:twitching motility protein PilT